MAKYSFTKLWILLTESILLVSLAKNAESLSDNAVPVAKDEDQRELQETAGTNLAFRAAMSGNTSRIDFCDENMMFFQLIADGGNCEAYSASQAAPYVNAGLTPLPGFYQQLDFAVEYLADCVDGDVDLFLVMVGGNDFFGHPSCYPNTCNPPPEYTSPDEEYDIQTGAWTVQNIAQGLERLYDEIGARQILLANFREPCVFKEWFNGGDALAPVCRLRGILPDEFVLPAWNYSRVWMDQVNAGLEKLARDFNQDHSDGNVIFVDFETPMMNRFTDDSEWEFETTCQTAFLGNYVPYDDFGYNCFNHAFLDQDHASSEFIESIVDEVLPGIINELPPNMYIRRLFTFGDSNVDNGALTELQIQAGLEVNELSPPYSGNGGATNRYTVSEWLEVKLEISSMAQPFRLNDPDNENTPLSCDKTQQAGLLENTKLWIEYFANLVLLLLDEDLVFDSG